MEEIKRACLSLIEESPMAVLSTIDLNGCPDTRGVFNLRCTKEFPHLKSFFDSDVDKFTLFFITNSSSRKMEQIKINNSVSTYFCNFSNSVGIMLFGNIETVENMAVKEKVWHNSWSQFYPQGPEDKEYTLLKLKPKSAKGWFDKSSFKFSAEDME